MKLNRIPYCARAAFVLVAAVGHMGIAFAITPSPQEVVRKSVDAIKADWAQAPKYSYFDQDVESKRHSTRTSKTYHVFFIDGSPYNMITAINDHPLSSQQQAAERTKLQNVIEKRKNESARERERRIAKYEKGQDRNHRMLEEMVDAFQFHLDGEANVDGHDCWVLNAEPRAGYQPTDHEGKVLNGMKGRLWIDKATGQWVKVHAEVVKPVSFYGFLAKVGPGTEFDLEQTPVASGVWLAKHFSVSVKATALGFFNENSFDSDTYRDYQLMPSASALLQSTK